MTNQTTDLFLLPAPRKLELTGGNLAALPQVLYVNPAQFAYAPLQQALADLGWRAEADPAVAPNCVSSGGSVQTLPPPARAEGYRIEITPQGLSVSGHDSKGLVWGLVTLGQIKNQTRRLPCCSVEDWPEYRIRYHHDDISRRQVSTTEDFLSMVRKLAGFKYSHYTLYMEDLFELPGEPQFGCGRGVLSADDIRKIVAEGELRQVEVFPTLSLLGHQESMLRLPRFRPFGAATWQPPSSFDPSAPGVRDHVLRILDAICPLFPSPFFHMAFDECIGVSGELFLEHANWCAEQLVARGKIPLFWADMLYNHFDVAQLEKMHPALLPVVWNYAPSGGKAREVLPELLRLRPGTWMLAGYGSNRTLMHKPMEELHEQWENWRKISPPATLGGFGAAYWGDVGDNLRDAIWPVIGAFAEVAWLGEGYDIDSAPERFNVVFHGARLPQLPQLRRRLESGLALDSTSAWKLRQVPVPGWQRLAKAGKLPTVAESENSLQLLEGSRHWLADARRTVKHHKAQLDHWQLAIERMTATFQGVIAAREPTDANCRKAANGLRRVRKTFCDIWYQHNRPEGIENTLESIDAQIARWLALPRPAAEPAAKFHPLDIDHLLNVNSESVCGMPVGLADLDGVPFRFAGLDKTFGELAQGQTVNIPLPGVAIRDLQIVCTQPRVGEVPQPGARLRLFNGDQLVYEEELLNILHLCDWWAPLGEHMWAGGSLAYVDPMRVRWLCSPRELYGLTVLSRFPWHSSPTADRLELTGLLEKPLQLFAITVVEAIRR